MIQGLQYFTQAYVAASVAAGQASQAGDDEHARARLPGGLDALLPDAPLLARLPLLPHGLRLGDGDAAARRRVRGDADHRPQLAPLGALRRSGPMSDAAADRHRVRRRRDAAARVRRRRFLVAVAEHSLLIAPALAFLAPFVFIVLTVADDERPGALARALADAVPRGRTSSTSSTRRRSGAGRSTRSSTRASRRSALARLEHPGRLRARRGCAGAGRDAVFLVVLVALMLPPQVTVVPLYVMWAKLAPRRHALAADHPELVRRRVLDLPAAPVLPDDPGGVPRRRARRRLRRVPHPDDGRAAARQAGDRGGRALLVPLHVQRLLPAAALRRREPGQLGRSRSASRSSARSTRCSGT